MVMKLLAAMLMLGGAAMAAQSPPEPTFHKDVFPILQKNCQVCHRPGQIGPMSFLSYQSTRPWAKAMKEAVATKKMPPWFADPNFGHFENDRTLKQSEIDTIVKWADAGAPEGDAKDAPRPVPWPENGWVIKPDVIVNGPEFTVPAKGIVEWTTTTIPSGFTKDTWITSIEVRTSQPTVTHHICITFRPHTPDVVYNVPKWTDKNRDEGGSELPGEKRRLQIPNGQATNIDACYVPGMQGADYRPFQAGKLIPAGTDISFSMHYTPNGTDFVDRPQVGFTVAKEEPKRRYLNYNLSSPQDAAHFAIPPNDPDWESPVAEATFEEDVELVWMFSHMHVRGKDMTYRLLYPDGRLETILRVVRYDYRWQLGYDVKPVKIPKGTRLVVTAHYDNSANNTSNPDPNRTVYYGDQAWEEMMSPFFAIIVDKNVNPKKILKIQVLSGNGA